MYKIEWDTESGGVLLRQGATAATLGVAPRPVFHEELDLIGLDALGFTYPRGEAPLLWAVNKQYWYRGTLLFQVRGADIYTRPAVVLADGVRPQSLAAVDVQTMLSRNDALMAALESEAVEFIRSTFSTYSRASRTAERQGAQGLDYAALAERTAKRAKREMAVVREDCDSFDVMPAETAREAGKTILLATHIDRFIASFSGGKDSQVVLDLCTRAMAPADFTVIYSDTGYELPPSLTLYDEVRHHYQRRFPALRFLTARNHAPVLDYWDTIGTPSDTHRWCCSVMKTAPLYRMLRSETGQNSKFLAFEGVRAEESVSRNAYNRIGRGVKHSFVVNARPILNWNTVEVFLYLFRHGLHINPAYRVGKPRVGCVLCPFGSPWDDMIVNNCYKEKLQPFLTRIEREVKLRKIPNDVEYIADRRWKMRGSGKFSFSDTSARFDANNSRWEAKVKDAKKDVLTWLPALCEFTMKESAKGFAGELMFKGKVYPCNMQYGDRLSDFQFLVNDDNNVSLRFLLRRVINKTAYCINCEACELECPNGALSVYPKVVIDKKRCTHCHKCLEYHNVGCIVADSSMKPTDTNLSNMRISKYGTFGIHEEWLDAYLRDPETYWKDNTLGVKQVPSFKAWLKDAEIIDAKGEFTPLGSICQQLNENGAPLLWEVIYINLVHNSPMMKWFVTSIPFNKDVSRKEIDRLAIDYFQTSFKESTVTYAVQALAQVFKYSPTGESLRQWESQDAKGLTIRRSAYNDISIEAVAYSLYKYGKAKDMKMLRVSDLYREDEVIGLYKEFGVERNELLKKLRSLSSDSNRVLVAELNMGLEHITLRDDLTPLTALQTLLS